MSDLPVHYVYGDFCGYGISILREETAERLARIGDDIEYGLNTSLGQYIQRCRQNPDLYGEHWIDELTDSVREELLGSSLANTGLEILPGYDEMSFPPDPRFMVIEELPEEIIEGDIVRVIETALDGWMTSIQDGDVPTICAAIRSLGHEIREDQALFDRMKRPG